MTSSPLFKKTVRLLLLIAVIELAGAALALAPRLVSTVAGQLASKIKSHEALLSLQSKEENLLSLEEKHARSLPQTKPLPAVALSPSFPFLHPQNTTSSGKENNLPDASLALIDVQQALGNEGEHTLKIAIKSQTQDAISIPQVKVQVYFYDEVNGEVVASKSPVESRWLSLPDWKNGAPQLLEVTYHPESGTPIVHYVGYIVAVYYKGKLQGYRVDPPELSTQFPIKVDIGNTEL